MSGAIVIKEKGTGIRIVEGAARGSSGQSAYVAWLAAGNSGSVSDFIGDIAYQAWSSLGNSGTKADFLNSLKGAPGPGLNNRDQWVGGSTYTSSDYVFADDGNGGQAMYVARGAAGHTFVSTLAPKNDPTNWNKLSAPQGPPGTTALTTDWGDGTATDKAPTVALVQSRFGSKVDAAGALAAAVGTDLTQAPSRANLLANTAASLIGYIANATGAVGRKVLDKFREHGALTPEDFGAVGDGVTDDYAALQAWLTAVGALGKYGRLGPKTYCHSQPLTSTDWNVYIKGAGSRTTLKYIGTSTAADHFVIGGPNLDTQGWTLRDFVFDSGTVKTAGACLHAYNIQHTALDNVFVCPAGANAPTNVFDGFFFQGVGYVRMINCALSSGRGKGLKVCSRDGTALGTPPPTYVGWGVGVFIVNCKIGGFGWEGIHIGGGIGGFAINQTDVINNALINTARPNVQIDTALVGIMNRELMFGESFSADSSGTSAVVVDDSLASPGLINFNGSWLCSSARGHGLHIKNWGGASTAVGIITITGGLQYNNNGDGVRCDTPYPIVNVVGSNSRYNTGKGYNNTSGGTNLRVNARSFGNGGNNSEGANLLGGSAIEWAGYAPTVNSLNWGGPGAGFSLGKTGGDAILTFGTNVYWRSYLPGTMAFKAAGSQETFVLSGDNIIVRMPGPYASDAAAGSGGVTAGGLYKNSSGQVFVKL